MSNKKSVLKMIEEIKQLWENEEIYIEYCPSREMYCPSLHGDNECDCLENPDIHIIDLVLNPDWVVWEMEMMEGYDE